MWRPLKVASYIVHSAIYTISLIFYDQQKYCEKSENIIGLDSSVLSPFGFISVFGLTALLKIEIAFCFL